MCFSVEVEKNMLKLAKRFKAEVSLKDEAHFRELQKKSEDYDYIKEALNLKRKPTSLFFKEPTQDNRVFPGYFTDVIVMENGKKFSRK